MIVKERAKVIAYLKSRHLEKPYRKSKKFLEKDQLKIVSFKIRQPKSDGIYYFRITKNIVPSVILLMMFLWLLVFLTINKLT